MTRAVLLLFVLLSGCAEKHALPVATGPLRLLNPGHWTPGPNELTTPPGRAS